MCYFHGSHVEVRKRHEPEICEESASIVVGVEAAVSTDVEQQSEVFPEHR